MMINPLKNLWSNKIAGFLNKIIVLDSIFSLIGETEERPFLLKKQRNLLNLTIFLDILYALWLYNISAAKPTFSLNLKLFSYGE